MHASPHWVNNERCGNMDNAAMLIASDGHIKHLVKRWSISMIWVLTPVLSSLTGPAQAKATIPHQPELISNFPS